MKKSHYYRREKKLTADKSLHAPEELFIPFQSPCKVRHVRDCRDNIHQSHGEDSAQKHFTRKTVSGTPQKMMANI